MTAPSSRRAAAQALLDASIPKRMERALGALAVATTATGAQPISMTGGGSHATSSIPAGVSDRPSVDGAGVPLVDRSAFDHFTHRWNRARTPFERRLVCYQAERAVDELRHTRRGYESSQDWERRLLRQVGVDALELAVREDVSPKFIRYMRHQAGRDGDFGWVRERTA